MKADSSKLDKAKKAKAIANKVHAMMYPSTRYERKKDRQLDRQQRKSRQRERPHKGKTMKTENKKALKPITPRNTSMQNAMDIEKGLREVVQSVDKLLPVHLAKSIDDINYLIDRATAVEGRFSLARCKLFYKVKAGKLFEKEGFSNFAKWAEGRHGEKKSTAYNYAKIGAYINEQGNGTTLPKPSGNSGDYLYYALVMMITALVKFDNKTGEVIDDSLLISACEKGIITPYIASNRQDLKKAIKKAQGLEGEEVEESENLPEGEEVEEVEEGEEVEEVEEGESLPEVEKSFEMCFTRSEWAFIANILADVNESKQASQIALTIRKEIKKQDR